MLGDIGAAFMIFEKDLTLVREDEGEVVDGFVEKDVPTEYVFKGVVQKITGTTQFDQTLSLGVPGSRHMGDVVLYCRLGQSGLPNIVIGDKIRDLDGQVWKVEGVEDYSAWNLKLYDIVKVV